MESIVSQSTRSLSKYASDRASKGDSTNMYFAYFDQMTQSAQVPDLFYNICYLWVCLQFLNVGIWNTSVLDQYILFSSANTDSITMTIVYSVFFLLELFAFITPIAFYSQMHKFPIWSLYISRFSLEIIIPLLMTPVAWVFDIIFQKLSSGDMSTETIVCMVVIIVIEIYNIIIYIISQLFFNHTAFMSSSPVYCFKPGPLYLFMLTMTLLVILKSIFVVMPDYAWQILCVVHSIILIYLGYLALVLPFFQYWVNGVYAGVITGAFLENLMYFSPVHELVRFGIGVGVAVVSSIIYCIIIYLKVKKFTNLLKGNSEEIQNYNDYFKEIKADQYLLLYLHIGLKEHTQLFTNQKLFRYYVDKTMNIETEALCLRCIVILPSFHSLLNVFFNLLDSNLKLSFPIRFLLAQVYRIKLLRQSSASFNSANQLDQMREIDRNLRIRTSHFWKSDNPSIPALGQLDKEIGVAQIRWQQAITDFPNSQNHREEYIRFLVDVATDFQEACRQHYINSLIETGRNFTIDYCFRSLINVCPDYMKRTIVDCNGNIIEPGKRNGSSSSNKGASQATSSSISELDAKLEESIGKGMLRQSRMRLALQNSLRARKSNNLSNLSFISCGNALLSGVIIIVLYCVFVGFFDQRSTSINLNMMISEFSWKFNINPLYQLLAWTNNTTPHRFDRDVSLYNIPEPVSYKSLWNGEDFYVAMGKMFYNAKNIYQAIITEITNMASDGEQVYDWGGPMYSDVINCTLCTVNNSLSGAAVQMNLLSYYMYLTHNFGLMQTRNFPYNVWWTDNMLFCTAFINVNLFVDGWDVVRSNLMYDENDNSYQIGKVIDIIKIELPIAFELIVVISYYTSFGLSLREIANLFKMMMKILPEHKQDATKSILRADNSAYDMSDGTSSFIGSNTFTIINAIMVFIAMFAATVCMIAIMFACDNLNKYHSYVSYWSYKSSSRELLILNTLLHVYELILITGNNPVPQNMFIENEMVGIINKRLSDIRKIRAQLGDGEGNIEGILGFDPKIDALLNLPYCEAKKVNATTHDTYSCGSVQGQISMLDDFITNLMTKRSVMNSTLINDLSMNVFHLALAHVCPQLAQLDDLLSNLLVNLLEDFKLNLLIYLIVGLIVTIIVLIFELSLVKLTHRPYNAALTLLRRVSPIGIVNNTELIDYLLNRHSEKASSEMSTSKAVIYNAADAIFLLSYGGTIESMNMAVSKTLGYTPEQLLGQHFDVVFNEKDKEKVSQQLQLMISKQSAPQYDDHFNCLSDTDQIVPCNVIIFGMTSNNGDVESFVAVLRDETDLVENQMAAETAKKQSEDLLYQILPRDIVIRLNQGEKDISFEVASASIMFIDIIKFSEFSASLTPSEIMGTLSALFGGFDECIAKYPLLTKIKLIGDVYMCAAGLFSPEEAPAHHAEQLLRFGIEALTIVDEINVKLTANLAVRIGMNSGGPLIAGVLGTDKPVFDIIGDPINIASRLQSTDIPGRVQISQSVFDLVSNLDFNIEPRGEIYLKGKGKTNSFLVNPFEGVISRSSSLLNDSNRGVYV